MLKALHHLPVALIENDLIVTTTRRITYLYAGVFAIGYLLGRYDGRRIEEHKNRSK